jgi:hypothetical protein
VRERSFSPISFISIKKIAKALKLTLGGLQQRLHKQLMMLPCLSLFAFFDTNNFQTI